ncbi:MAG: exo-alpha-sialidase [Planctomycetota bacterium]|nr:MAG: exo-alpha-sialidase [Planctomycetota bacterium]
MAGRGLARRQKLSRRAFLAAVGAGTPLFIGRHARAAPGKFQVDDVRTISRLPHQYHGWPTVTRRRNGQLVLTYSGGREAHVCPFGRVEMMTSDDGGDTWTYPRVLLDSALDDRDSGVLETSRGTLLVTTFTSTAYVPILERAIAAEDSRWPDDRLDRWSAAHRRLSDDQRKRDLGCWMLRSTDGGMTFSARYDSIVNSPHGPIELADGRLLYLGKELWAEEPWVGACVSTDDGRTWRRLSRLPVRPGDTPENYHELHGVECPSGKIVCHIRNHNKANEREILQCESTDGGATWSVPHAIGVWGLPSHLLRLRDGRILMSYGYRREPFGCRVRVSVDEGATWSEEIVLYDRATNGDLGYPSTVELADGRLLSIWYELTEASPYAVLRQCRWRLRD